MSFRFQRIQRSPVNIMGKASRAVFAGGGASYLELLGFITSTRPRSNVDFLDDLRPTEVIWAEGQNSPDVSSRRFDGLTFNQGGNVASPINPGTTNFWAASRDRVGTDDGVGSFAYYDIAPAVPSLVTSFVPPNNNNFLLTRFYRNNVYLNNLPLFNNGNTLPSVAVFNRFCSVDPNSANYTIGRNDTTAVSAISVNSTVQVSDAVMRRCFTLPFRRSRNTAPGTFLFVGGSSAGVAIVELYSLNTDSFSPALVSQGTRSPGGTDVMGMQTVMQTQAGQGSIYISRPDGLAKYSFATVTGAWSLDWLVPGVDGGPLCVASAGNVIWANGNSLVVVSPTGVILGQLALPDNGDSPVITNVRYSNSTDRVAAASISNNGTGTDSYLYNIQYSEQLTAWEPEFKTLSCDFTESSGAFQQVAPESYGVGFFGNINNIERQPGGNPGFRMLDSVTSRVAQLSTTDRPFYWGPRNGNNTTTNGTWSAWFRPELAPLTSTAVRSLPAAVSSRNIGPNVDIISLYRGVLTGVDDEDRLRLVMQRPIAQPDTTVNGQGQWSFPCVADQWYHVVFAFSRFTDSARFWVNGQLVGSLDGVPGFPLWNPFSAGSQMMFGAGWPPAGFTHPAALGVHRYLRCWARVLNNVEVRALYNQQLTLATAPV